ncbi:RNA polymerase sigma-70 factor [Kribbella sp. NPDC051770]|uniref:RNA polymerase sigma-70 factor n=1 Tax=Kribbella sp. NPDC051770 TaxID=3155413 RepID=UPI003436E559
MEDSFERERGRMFAIAYRMLGTVTDAEEVLQDAWLRWQGVDQSTVTNPTGFLVKTVTNLCLNQLTSARARRETYVGEWLPEPVLTNRPGPLDVVSEREEVSFALLTLLERLSPPERAAYVLREAFGYSHREVAELIGTSEANARQLHARARKHVAVEEPRNEPVDRTHWQELVSRFLAAAHQGDLEGLTELLTADVVSRSDGGGKVSAARLPVVGADKVARYLLGSLVKFGADVEFGFTEANGEPALLATDPTGVRAVCFVTFSRDLISSLDLAMNPDKLHTVERQLTMA